MATDTSATPVLRSSELTEAMIRFGLIAVIVFLALRTFAPFVGIMLWALVLAVALYPLNRALARRVGGSQGRAATILVIAALLLIGVPTVMLGGSFATYIHDVYQSFASGQVEVPAPNAAVAEWPLIGERLYAAWNTAADDLPAFLESLQPQLGMIARRVLGLAASTAGAVLLFLGAMIIAGIMMAYAESGTRAMQRIFSRFAGGDKGPELHRLSVATIRSVATGVIGVAFIQALLLGIGFLLAGIPAAGVLALMVLFVGILQLPALIVSLPAIGYLWWAGDSSTTVNVVFTIYLLVAGMADNVLKPMLLGRGVDVPMPVVLLGALGGMVSAGMVGLFIGAVVLSVAYQVFMTWVDAGVDEMTPAVASPEDGLPRG